MKFSRLGGFPVDNQVGHLAFKSPLVVGNIANALSANTHQVWGFVSFRTQGSNVEVPGGYSNFGAEEQFPHRKCSLKSGLLMWAGVVAGKSAFSLYVVPSVWWVFGHLLQNRYFENGLRNFWKTNRSIYGDVWWHNRYPSGSFVQARGQVMHSFFQMLHKLELTVNLTLQLPNTFAVLGKII